MVEITRTIETRFGRLSPLLPPDVRRVTTVPVRRRLYQAFSCLAATPGDWLACGVPLGTERIPPRFSEGRSQIRYSGVLNAEHLAGDLYQLVACRTFRTFCSVPPGNHVDNFGQMNRNGVRTQHP